MNYWRKVGSSHKGHPEIHQDHMEGSRRKLHFLLVKVLGAGTRCLLQKTNCGVMTLCKDKFSEARSLHPHRVTQQGPGAGGAPAQWWTASAGLSLFPPQTIDQDWSGSVYLQRRYKLWGTGRLQVLWWRKLGVSPDSGLCTLRYPG